MINKVLILCLLSITLSCTIKEDIKPLKDVLTTGKWYIESKRIETTLYDQLFISTEVKPCEKDNFKEFSKDEKHTETTGLQKCTMYENPVLKGWWKLDDTNKKLTISVDSTIITYNIKNYNNTTISLHHEEVLTGNNKKVLTTIDITYVKK